MNDDFGFVPDKPIDNSSNDDFDPIKYGAIPVADSKTTGAEQQTQHTLTPLVEAENIITLVIFFILIFFLVKRFKKQLITRYASSAFLKLETKVHYGKHPKLKTTFLYSPV